MMFAYSSESRLTLAYKLTLGLYSIRSDLDRKIQTDFVLNLGKFAKSDDEQRDCRDGRRRPPASPALAQHAIGLNGVIE
jgi:hypothetical protein